MSADEPEVLPVSTAAQWERWLAKNHARVEKGVWLRLGNKGSTHKSPTYLEAVEVALCYGWIDGQAKKYDESSRLQKFTPRRARSIWSKINTERVARLTEEGRMKPAGFAAVEAAKNDGRWAAAYDSPRKAEIPKDFLAALNKNKKAKAFFATLNKRNTFAVSFQLQNAKKPETRARRIAKFVDMFERGERLY